MPKAKVNQQLIAYREQGTQRPAVVLLHGAGASSWVFMELMRLLGPHRHTLALDLPGHGQSPEFVSPPAVPELLGRYRDLVAELAEYLGLGRFVLVGHSMSGAVAQLFALTYPDRLAGLVLMATGARLKVAPVIPPLIRERFEGLAPMIAAVGYSPASEPQRVRQWATDHLQASQAVVLKDFLACGEYDQRPNLGGINCPTLIISGADDRLTPPKLQQQLAALIPKARLETLSRAGHFLYMERPEPVAQLILQMAN